MCLKRRSYKKINKQAGFLLPLALFILVVMSLFALVLTRNTIQTGTGAVLEVISTQTFYAAESGAQSGMQVLFYPNASTRNGVDTRCVNLNATYTYSVTGLQNCSAQVTCTCVYADNSSCSPSTVSNYSSAAAATKLNSFYKVSSLATCGSGKLSAKRTIEVGSFMKQE
jgi:MSHA biogenesis protein MshP